MTFTFTIPGRLPGLNEIITAARGRAGWFAGAGQKKKWMRYCSQAIIAERVPVFQKPVRIIFVWFEPNGRRDIDNIQSGGSKFICDALVQRLRIPDDSRKWVREVIHKHPDPDKKNPRIEVTIEEL